MHKRNIYLCPPPLPSHSASLYLSSSSSPTPLWTRKRASLPFNRVYIINCSALGLHHHFLPLLLSLPSLAFLPLFIEYLARYRDASVVLCDLLLLPDAKGKKWTASITIRPRFLFPPLPPHLLFFFFSFFYIAVIKNFRVQRAIVWDDPIMVTW